MACEGRQGQAGDTCKHWSHTRFQAPGLENGQPCAGVRDLGEVDGLRFEAGVLRECDSCSSPSWVTAADVGTPCTGPSQFRGVEHTGRLVCDD